MSTTAGSGRHLSPPLTTVFKVTNLSPDGPGSLQECIYAKGPRTCVFEVSGTIDLTGDTSYDGSKVINLKHPYITIAGQTAPSPGITVRGKTLRIEAHDVLIQHLRFRVGDSPHVLVKPDVRDTILIAGSHDDQSRTPHNIVIDHCSVSWGIDEVLSIKDTSHNITLSNNIISEGLDRSLHPKGRHSKGLMAVGNYLSIYRNLIASIVDRAPLDISPNSIYINNLSNNAKHATFSQLARSKFHLANGATRNTVMHGNVRNIGVNTPGRGDALWGQVNPDLRAGSKVFQRDNLCDFGDRKVAECEVRDMARVEVERAPIRDHGIEIWPAATVQEKVLEKAGARPSDRDAVDQRIIDEVVSGSAKVPDCVADQPLFYPVGDILNSDGQEVTIALGHCHPGRFEGQRLELLNRGNEQVHTIVKHSCPGANVNTLKLDSKFAQGSISEPQTYRIHNQCDNHAGGFPQLAENTRTLSLPSDFNRLTASGYTVLEEYLHGFYQQVE